MTSLGFFLLLSFLAVAGTRASPPSLLSATPAAPLPGDPAPVRYLGTEACQGCHPQEYANFKQYAKKANSFSSIERLRDGLTPEEVEGCYHCHTTGYGRPGGFVSPQQTPQLANAGCEVCHGPGERHAASREPGDIKGRLTLEDCEVCHVSARVEAFRFKPLIHGGAH
ncbi:MAG: cytochrome c family protein [Thermodesulfobacteriota bacterium]